MKRTLIALMAVMFAAASANALASVSVTPSNVNPNTGDVITLTVRVSVTPGDGTDASLFGAIQFPTGGITVPVAASITQFAFSPVAPGTAYGLGALSCTTARCVLFNQTAGTQGPQAGDVSDFVIATQSYTITAAVGTVLTWNWQSTPSTQALSFFNAVAPVPAASVTVIPEPTTAALLGLGLFGLAVAGRRRA